MCITLSRLERFKADTFISHDPLVLQWLVIALGYGMLLTDIGYLLQTSLFGLSTILPPRERADLLEAKDKCVSFGNASLTLHCLFQLYGKTVFKMALRGLAKSPCSFPSWTGTCLVCTSAPWQMCVVHTGTFGCSAMRASPPGTLQPTQHPSTWG